MAQFEPVPRRTPSISRENAVAVGHRRGRCGALHCQRVGRYFPRRRCARDARYGDRRGVVALPRLACWWRRRAIPRFRAPALVRVASSFRNIAISIRCAGRVRGGGGATPRRVVWRRAHVAVAHTVVSCMLAATSQWELRLFNGNTCLGFKTYYYGMVLILRCTPLAMNGRLRVSAHAWCRARPAVPVFPVWRLRRSMYRATSCVWLRIMLLAGARQLRDVLLFRDHRPAVQHVHREQPRQQPVLAELLLRVVVRRRHLRVVQPPAVRVLHGLRVHRWIPA